MTEIKSTLTSSFQSHNENETDLLQRAIMLSDTENKDSTSMTNYMEETTDPDKKQTCNTKPKGDTDALNNKTNNTNKTENQNNKQMKYVGGDDTLVVDYDSDLEKL